MGQWIYAGLLSFKMRKEEEKTPISEKYLQV